MNASWRYVFKSVKPSHNSQRFRFTFSGPTWLSLLSKISLLACRSPLFRFHGDICTTAQAPLDAQGWPSGKQRLANKSITLPLCPQRQIADSWILFNSGATPLCDESIALTMKLRSQRETKRQTVKQQASMITITICLLSPFAPEN